MPLKNCWRLGARSFLSSLLPLWWRWLTLQSTLDRCSKRLICSQSDVSGEALTTKSLNERLPSGILPSSRECLKGSNKSNICLCERPFDSFISESMPGMSTAAFSIGQHVNSYNFSPSPTNT